jgi:FkbM family methyltransferase
MEGSTLVLSADTLPLPPGTAIRRGIKVRAGVSFSVVTEADPNESIARHFAKGIFPPILDPLVRLVESLVPPGGRVLDLGSHIGTFALAVAATGREVVAVEASPSNFELLDRSRRLNRFENLRVVNAAVAEGPGELRFLQSGPFGFVDKDSSYEASVCVPAIAVDDLLEQVGWDRVDFIKMDIEGSEVAGLLGMSRLLTGPQAPPLHVESNGHTLRLFNETPSSLKAALGAYGYRLFQVEDRRLIPVEIHDYQATTVVDYLALKAAPPSGRPWRVAPPMSCREQIRRARRSCRSDIPLNRLYAARTIGQAPLEVTTDRQIVKALAALQADENPEIRESASAWSFTARPQPWYAFWRR